MLLPILLCLHKPLCECEALSSDWEWQTLCSNMALMGLCSQFCDEARSRICTFTQRGGLKESVAHRQTHHTLEICIIITIVIINIILKLPYSIVCYLEAGLFFPVSFPLSGPISHVKRAR